MDDWIFYSFDSFLKYIKDNPGAIKFNLRSEEPVLCFIFSEKIDVIQKAGFVKLSEVDPTITLDSAQIRKYWSEGKMVIVGQLAKNLITITCPVDKILTGLEI